MAESRTSSGSNSRGRGMSRTIHERSFKNKTGRRATAGKSAPSRLIGWRPRSARHAVAPIGRDRRAGWQAPGRPIMGLVSVPSVTVRGIGERAEQAMAGYVAEFEVLGPWSLETSRQFWEGFTPAALAGEPGGPRLRTVFCAEGDWRRAEAEVTQSGDTARVVLAGDGDLDAAAVQVGRFLALDVDGRGWPQVGRRDPVIAAAQARLPGLRP